MEIWKVAFNKFFFFGQFLLDIKSMDTWGVHLVCWKHSHLVQGWVLTIFCNKPKYGSQMEGKNIQIVVIDLNDNLKKVAN